MRFALAVVAAYVVMAVLAIPLYGWILNVAFEPLSSLFRPADAQAQTAIWAHLAQMSRALVFGALVVLLHGARPVPIPRGLLYGLLMGLFAGSFHVANSAALPIPPLTAIAWVAFDTALLCAAGLTFALSYRPVMR